MFASLRKKLKDIVMQGADPSSLAWSFSLGAVVGLFPVLGSTTLLCAALGTLLKLNHAALQGANYAVYPLQIPAVLLFVAAGDAILGQTTLTLSATEISEAVQADALGFAVTFARAGLHAILAWMLVAPLLLAVMFFPLRTLFTKLLNKRDALN
jgi:uncharacterized protein (DUF2062 family)